MREVFVALRSSLFNFETLLQGRFPAKKHIANGRDTVDGRNPANQLISSLSHYLQGFIHPRMV